MATNTYEALLTSTVTGSPASSIVIGSGNTIPQGYTDLRLVLNTVGSAVSGGNLCLRFNSDTNTYTSATRILSDGSSFAGGRNTQTQSTGMMIGDPANADKFIAEIDIMNYSNTTTFKTVFSKYTGTTYMGRYVGLWAQTSAITQLTLIINSSMTFAVGTTVTLYGIKADTNDYTVKATGGNIVVADQSYVYHAFTSSGTFTPTTAVTADILVVAGGGGGGCSAGCSGGGGAGGVLAFASQSLTTSGYTVTVGGPGAGALTSGGDGTSGTNSQFASLTASVGGGGGGAGGSGLNGGSGGGGGYFLNTNNGPGAYGGAGTSGQGSNGGQGYAATNNHAGAGGGGAGGNGGNVVSVGVGGTGGSGATTYTNWGSLSDVLRAATLGVNGYLASGGAGGAYYNFTSGANGGGNGGTVSSAAGTGTANTGSGGGGAGGNSYAGAAGGSGLVIVRYPRNA